MVTTDTLEGIINGTISYHYDVTSDVLYLRLLTDMTTPSLGEKKTTRGSLSFARNKPIELIGLTIVSWWKRISAKCTLPDSISQIQRLIEPLATKVAA